MGTNLQSPSGLQIVTENQLILPERPTAVATTAATTSTESAKLNTSASTAVTTELNQDSFVQLAQLILLFLKNSGAFGATTTVPVSTPVTSTPVSTTTPTATTGQDQVTLSSGTPPTPTGAYAVGSYRTEDGRTIAPEPGMFQTKFGTLVQSSSGNSNLYKRNGADENTVYYYDAKNGWQSMSIEDYRAKSDEWVTKMANPSAYGTQAGQVYRTQGMALNDKTIRPTEFLDIYGTKPMTTKSYSAAYSES